jgi:hypothetical protein
MLAVFDAVEIDEDAETEAASVMGRVEAPQA